MMRLILAADRSNDVIATTSHWLVVHSVPDDPIARQRLLSEIVGHLRLDALRIGSRGTEAEIAISGRHDTVLAHHEMLGGSGANFGVYLTGKSRFLRRVQVLAISLDHALLIPGRISSVVCHTRILHVLRPILGVDVELPPILFVRKES